MAGGVTTYAMVLAMLDEPFDKAEAWGNEYGIPSKRIYLGEFGMIRQEYRKKFRMPSSWRAAYLEGYDRRRGKARLSLVGLVMGRRLRHNP